jgi:hypothetical protein
MKKVCNHCKIEKDTTDFTPIKNKLNQFIPSCKICRNLKQQERRTRIRLEHPEKCRKFYVPFQRESEILKECSKCHEYKKLTEFPKKGKNRLSAECKLCKCKRWKEKWSNDSEWRRHKLYRNNEYMKEKMKSDIFIKIKNRLSNRIRDALRSQKQNKRNKTADLLGCNINFFKHRLESQFQKGMSWKNYGKWHIDHIRPCASFDLTDLKQQKLCFHYTNLQPLWSKDNMTKNDKMPDGSLGRTLRASARH